MTSVLTSNRTEHGTPPQEVRRSHEGDLISVVRRATEANPQPRGQLPAVSRPLPRPPALLADGECVTVFVSSALI